MHDHPMRHSNTISAETLVGSKEFVLSFDEEGIERLESGGLFSCMAPFFS